ncbi:MAG: LysE/ArgO family amino acid transporter [Rhodoglobus sp.]
MDIPLAAVLTGLATGFGLIIAIGAQNTFVLRLGISGPARAIFAVVAICAVSDAVLIFAGVLGIGVLVEQVPIALVVLRFLGAGFLIVYGTMAGRRALRPKALTVETPGGEASTLTMAQPKLSTAVLTALAFTWLNPHVYLDTLVFLGSIANQQGDLRWLWAGGAIAASVIWFFALGFGARFLRPIFARPMAWRILDSAIAVFMIGLGLKLVIWG